MPQEKWDTLLFHARSWQPKKKPTQISEKRVFGHRMQSQPWKSIFWGSEHSAGHVTHLDDARPGFGSEKVGQYVIFGQQKWDLIDCCIHSPSRAGGGERKEKMQLPMLQQLLGLIGPIVITWWQSAQDPADPVSAPKCPMSGVSTGAGGFCLLFGRRENFQTAMGKY